MNSCVQLIDNCCKILLALAVGLSAVNLNANAYENSYDDKAASVRSPERADAADEMLRTSVQSSRLTYGKKSAILAYDLEQLAARICTKVDLEKVVPLLQEWLTIYPDLDNDDQRVLANQALYIVQVLRAEPAVKLTSKNQTYEHYIDTSKAHRQLADAMLDKVLDAATAGYWLPHYYWRKIFVIIAEGHELSPSQRALAQKLADAEGTPQARRAELLVGSLEGKIQGLPTDYYGEKAIPIISLPPLVTNEDETNKLINELISLYPKLCACDQHALTARILHCTDALLHTGHRENAAKLLWLIVEKINPHWISDGSIATGLLNNYWFYYQKKDCESASKLMHTTALLENHLRFYFNADKLISLGDLYRDCGQLENSKREYALALEWKKKVANDGK